MRVAAIACIALVLQGCGSAFPPAPPRATSFPPRENIDPSVVAIPVSVRLRNIERAVNRSGSQMVLSTGWRSVKASSSDGFADVRTLVAQHLNAKVVGSRFVPSEFRLTARRGEVEAGAERQGDALRVGFNERYELELRSRAGRYVCSPSAHRAIRAAARVAETVRPDGTVHPTVTDLSDRITAHCNVARSLLGGAEIDLSPVLREPYARVLYRVADTLTAVVQRAFELVVRAKFAVLARVFAQPQQLSTNAWLTPNLQNATVRRFSFAANGGDLLANFEVALAARPQISLGDRPPASPASVPRFSDLETPDGFHLPIDIRVPFEKIAEHARTALKGTELPIKVLGTVRVDDVDVFATDAGTSDAPHPQFVVQVNFSGGASGKLFLWGTPTIDPATRIISMPDLTYTTDTRRLLVRVFAPLLTSNFVLSRVRSAASFDASSLIDEQTAPFLKPYEQTITTPDGTMVAVHGVPAPIGLSGIGLDAEALFVHAMVTGTLTAAIDTDVDAVSLLGGGT